VSTNLYHTLAEDLTGRCREARKVGNNTYKHRRGEDAVAVRLHDTDVLTAHRGGRIVLNSGGWHTVTTKDRIRAYLPAPWSLISERGRWYITRGRYVWETKDATAPCHLFADGITLHASGKVTHAGKGNTKADDALKRRVAKYAALAAAALPLEKPSGGDCWHCYMVSQDGRALGDVSGAYHLREHMREGYVVPSLVYNALKEAGAGPAWYWEAFGETPIRDYARKHVARCVRRYMLKRFGFAA
jgi:hypothetical protein